MTVAEVLSLLNDLAPPDLAEEGDHIGLQAGTPSAVVNRILVALDVTDGLLDRAERAKTDLLVLHHPLIFHPLVDLRTDRPGNRWVARVLRNRLNVIVAHTNLDNAPAGLGRALADRLGLTNLRSLNPRGANQFKVIVFVPAQSTDKVLQAMTLAGAGTIGYYSHCSFQISGIGTFLPLPGAKPAVGMVGTPERVEELRLEMLVPSRSLSAVLAAMIESHPYEEVAYDVYPLANKDKAGGALWMGEWEESLALIDAAEKVCQCLRTETLRYVGNSKKRIRKVAVCPGSGRSFVDDASQAGADVLVTGDLDYHTAREAQHRELGLIDAGHFATEYLALELLVNHLRVKLSKNVKVTAFHDQDPFQFHCTARKFTFRKAKSDT